ncbi:MerR family transcriptional regulator [Microbacterium esteraromaticum]|uniref:helix-turn-helix domain-containing protein n=1 Tax=Microbacterium esteraromaticum TaxID=57043 RepID=UPI002368CA35|nr:helix-turn-helix domain-containing protein [Microbacterium esteraromaticum]WDH80166.1 MerR family transcriptional regulator [Microbacterium esteraromaticum]
MTTTDKELLPEEETLLTPGEAARRLHVTTRTLQRMALRGDVEAIVLPSGHRRYKADAIAAIRGVA